ncbi:MAG TPA: hypothetical protein VF698_07545 [Thermoanaerobaculia bacterium]
MRRVATLLVPLTSILAVAVVAMLVAPSGAVGEERREMNRGDRYFFGRNANIDQPVRGTVQVYGGMVNVADVIDGDLVVVGGDVLFERAGRVNGNVILGGGRMLNADGRVGGRVHPIASLEGAAASINKSAVAASLLVVWILAAVILTLMNGREVRFSSLEVRASALHCFALGLVALTSFVLTAIVFSYLVPYLIGIPLLAALGVFAILSKIYGMVVVFHAVGTLVAGARSRHQLAGRKWLRGDVAMVVIGALVLGIIRLIPGIGTIVWALASVFGIGVALATKFGRREPWFLEFRPVEA